MGEPFIFGPSRQPIKGLKAIRISKSASSLIVSLCLALGLACSLESQGNSESPEALESPTGSVLEARAVDLQPEENQLDRRPEAAKVVPFVPTPDEVVEAMLDLAEVSSEDLVFDLGSGDGRIVLAAARRGAQAVGVEIDPHLVTASRTQAYEMALHDKATFRQGDIFEADLTGATVVAIYLLPAINLKLLPKLLDELEPGTRLVSHSFDMDTWLPEKTEKIGDKTIFLWTIPEDWDRPYGY